jgi:hypothetical protein
MEADRVFASKGEETPRRKSRKSARIPNVLVLLLLLCCSGAVGG